MTDPRLYSAVIAHGGVWPSSLISGVMFYDGLRITVEDFVKAGGKIV